MTVYENMAFSLKMRKERKSVIHERVLEAAELLKITDYLYSKPSEISGGQRQRVALGRAIVRKAGVFLMDEPLSRISTPNCASTCVWSLSVCINRLKRHRFMSRTTRRKR